MTEQEKPDLSKIEPIGRPLDADDDAHAEQEPVQQERRGEPITSPETEAHLEELRRG
jgi:hypothetical protein